jgi:hypothetical protein
MSDDHRTLWGKLAVLAGFIGAIAALLTALHEFEVFSPNQHPPSEKEVSSPVPKQPDTPTKPQPQMKSREITNEGVVQAAKSIQAAVSNLGASYSIPKKNCSSEQTWIPQFGLRGLYCHIKDSLNFADLKKLAPVPIFLSGPHSSTGLNLNAKFDFGRYNPEFVRWIDRALVSALSDESFVRNTQALYEKHIHRQARTYYRAYQALQRNPVFLKREADIYLQYIKNHTLPELYINRFHGYSGLNPPENNEYEAPVAVLFWVRRYIDETDNEFYNVLYTLLKTYDPYFMMHQKWR